jgi:UDP-N-acetyl-D-mannosaminuronic acid dehydrogenase
MKRRSLAIVREDNDPGRVITQPFDRDVTIVGGCGHVGLPLGIALASRGLQVTLLDISKSAVDTVNAGILPFREAGAEQLVRDLTTDGSLRATTDPTAVRAAENVIVVTDTPLDEHLKPDPGRFLAAIGGARPFLRDGQLIVLRSTVYPGVTKVVELMIEAAELDIDVAFCPERIVEGNAMHELFSLPQIVAARTHRARARAAKLFGNLTTSIVEVEPEEAELAKLFSNAWRYIKFAAANQFYYIANDYGQDFERIRRALAADYPRAADLPRAGFAAGPCLFKDTAQLAAFDTGSFAIGNAAMLVNEALPLYIVDRLERRFDLQSMTVGLLGMSFKGESDDIRASLSYKLRAILEPRARAVLCTDPYVTVDPTLVPLEQVLADCDLLVVGAPHEVYRSIDPIQPVADVWNVFGRGVVI